jgi:hypothetical protein
MSDHTSDYRSLLVQTWQKAQDDFDKAVLSLSGGALGVSFIFLKDKSERLPFSILECYSLRGYVGVPAQLNPITASKGTARIS